MILRSRIGKLRGFGVFGGSRKRTPPIIENVGMGVCVTFVSGLRRSGKSALIQTMIDGVWKKKPHYLRLVKAGSDKVAPRPAPKKQKECGVASARWLEYNEERIFEILPEALSAIHKTDRYGSVVI